MVVIIIQYKILQICLIIIYTENGSLLNMMWNTVSFSSVFKKHLLINIYSVLYPGRSVSLLQDSYLYFLMLTYEEELIITRNEDVLGTKIGNHWVFKTNMWRKVFHFYFYRWTNLTLGKWVFSPGWHCESHLVAWLGRQPGFSLSEVLFALLCHPSWLHKIFRFSDRFGTVVIELGASVDWLYIQVLW